MPFQTEQQRQAALTAAGVSASSLPQPIAISSLSEPQTSMKATPSATVPPPPLPTVATPPATPPTTGAATPFISTLDTLTAQLKGKDLDAEASRTQATSAYEQQLNQINTQIAQANARAIENQERAMKTGETLGFATREAQNVARTDAIEMIKLSALQAGLQGNIALAEKQAQAAINAKYAQVEKDIETAKTNIYDNWSTFNDAERKRAEATLLRLDAEDAFVKARQAEETQITNLAMSALANGATTAQAEKIMNNDSFEGALKIGGSFLGAQFRLNQEQAAFDRGIKTRNLAIAEKEFGLKQRLSLLELAAAGDAAAIKDLGYDPRNKPLTTDEIAANEDYYRDVQNDVNRIGGMLANRTGLKTSAGVVRSPLLTSAVNPFGGLLVNYPGTVSKRNDFLTDAKYVIENLTFDKFAKLKERGVNLTPISNVELQKIGASSNALVAAARFDEAGNLIGFKSSEGKVETELKTILESYNRVLMDLDRQLTLSPEDEAEIKAIKR